MDAGAPDIPAASSWVYYSGNYYWISYAFIKSSIWHNENQELCENLWNDVRYSVYEW